MPAKTLKQYLDEKHVKYESIRHSPAYSAQKVAATTHIPGKELAKSVILGIDGRFAMAVLPASNRVHLGHLKSAVAASHAELVAEPELETLFPDCEKGAMPPFGNLYDMEVYVAEELTEDEEIAFTAGTHREVIRMAHRDYQQLVKPKVIALT